MPSIADAIKAAQANAAASPGGVNIAAPAPTPQNTVQSATPILDLPGGGGLPQRGMFPANLVLSGDRNDSSRVFRGTSTRSAVFPFPVTPQQAATVVTATQAAVAAATLSILTGNVLNPNQTQLNFQSGNNNLIITSDANGNETFTVVGSEGDGLIHMQTPWESDPSFIILRDDFGSTNSSAGSPDVPSPFVSELSWAINAIAGQNVLMSNSGGFPNFGSLFLNNGANASGAYNLTLNNNSIPGSNATSWWPLFDRTNWRMSWVFGFSTPNYGSAPSAQSFTKTSMYIGMGNSPALGAQFSTTTSPRLPLFLGLRYDTDSGLVAGVESLSLTSVAAGTGVYTGTVTFGAGNFWAGISFLVSGFTNAANNGTFLCTASTATTLTLVNSASVLETHAGTAVAPGTPFALTSVASGTGVYQGTIPGTIANFWKGTTFIVGGFTNAANNGTFLCTASSTSSLTLVNPSSIAETPTAGTAGARQPAILDTQMVFEMNLNPNPFAISSTTDFRNNTQGTTFSTGITPTAGSFYRLEIQSTTVGQVTLTLYNGSTSVNTTFTVPKFTATGLDYQAANGLGFWAYTTSPVNVGPFGAGSQVTIAGTGTAFDGAQKILNVGANGNNPNIVVAGTFGPTNASAATATGYVAVFPFLAFGCDNSASPSPGRNGLLVDYFAFVWNPGVGGGSGTPNLNLSRGF